MRIFQLGIYVDFNIFSILYKDNVVLKQLFKNKNNII